MLVDLWQALDLLASDQVTGSGISAPEFERVEGRLLLARRALGGLVQESYVLLAWKPCQSNLSRARGHNWELLRERAEDNHLYFQSIEPSGAAAPFALLWIDQADACAPVRFDSKFLGISDPFRDPRLRRWKDYSEKPRLRGRIQHGL